VTGVAPGAARAVGAAEEQAWNEAALARPVPAPALRLWTYGGPAVVVGRGQLDVRGAAAPVVRRETGGGAVFVGPHLLGVSVVLPAAHPLVAPSPARTFRWFGTAHAAALRTLGIACRTAAPGAGRADPALAWACFGGLGPWEVVTAAGRKLVGLAQRRRTSGVLLVSGTLLADPDWAPLCAAFGRPEAAPALARATSSCGRELGGAVDAARVARRITAALARAIASA